VATAISTGVSSEAFASAPGFPHAVVDHFLPDAEFAAIAEEFPSPDAMPEYGRTRAYQKAVAGDLTHFGPATRAVVETLQARPWLEHLSQVTGIPGLVADPTLAPHLAHATETGGFTRIHRDSSGHPACPLFRRVALILYLHREWDPSWGGDFEVWDDRLRSRLRRVAPLPNRAVIFATTPRAWHGFPDPITCPSGTSRRALTLWYWTAERPTGRGWAQADAAATFRPRRRSQDPTRWSMRQRSVRQVVLPGAVRRVLRRVLGRDR